MKSKILVYSIISLLGVGLLGVSIASARGWWFNEGNNFTPEQIAARRQIIFQNEADILGISVEEVKNAWADGKNIKQIIKERGIDQAQVLERMKNFHLKQLKAQLQSLVDKGIITQAQADKRLVSVQNKLQNAKVGNKGYKHMGMMGWGMRGFYFQD